MDWLPKLKRSLVTITPYEDKLEEIKNESYMKEDDSLGYLS
jgi:hypothetical protein